MNKEIQILLADDHALVRIGLRALLETEPQFRVIDEVDNGRDVLEKVLGLKPDVVILDLMMPNLNGLEVTRQISRSTERTKIVILSMHDDEGFVLEALRNGASGYVLKDSNSNYLIQAIKAVMNGGRYLSPILADRAIKAYQSQARSESSDLYDSLTAREREVLQLTAEGRTRAEIAAKLGVNARTVETHRANLMNKLNLKTKTELVRFAIKRGLIMVD